MYKEQESTNSGRQLAAELLPDELVKQLVTFRRRCLETYGRWLGRARVSEEFDRYFWRDPGAIKAWGEMSPQARNRRIRKFDTALRVRAKQAESNAEAKARFASRRADNDDLPPPEDLEPGDRYDGGTVSVEGYIIHDEAPENRLDCPDYRPCPYVTCKYHLYLDVTRRGRLRMNFPDTDVINLPMSCALDIAAEGPKTLEQIGRIMGGISRERVRQIEQAALNQLREQGDSTLVDFLSERAIDEDDE